MCFPQSLAAQLMWPRLITVPMQHQSTAHSSLIVGQLLLTVCLLRGKLFAQKSLFFLCPLRTTVWSEQIPILAALTHPVEREAARASGQSSITHAQLFFSRSAAGFCPTAAPALAAWRCSGSWDGGARGELCAMGPAWRGWWPRPLSGWRCSHWRALCGA